MIMTIMTIAVLEITITTMKLSTVTTIGTTLMAMMMIVKTNRPKNNVQSLYLYKDVVGRGEYLTVISGSDLKARARTREPCRVYFLYVST